MHLPAESSRRLGREVVFMAIAMALTPIFLVNHPVSAAVEEAWTAAGTQSQEALGFGVSPAGDVNGDGYSDFLVSSPWYDSNGADRGRLRLYLGSASGLGGTAVWQYDGERAGDHYGYSVAAVGDIDGDGYDDVLVGASLADVGSFSNNGMVNLFLGSPAGLPLEPDWILAGVRDDDLLGSYVAGLGDVNGDGFFDFAVGTPGYDVQGNLSVGRVDTVHGSSIGPAGAISFLGGHQSAYIGSWMDGLDMNGDGYDDLVFREFQGDGSAVYSVHLGSSSGVSPTEWARFTSGGWTGTSGAAVGDVNGDGYADLLLGDSNGGSLESGGASLLYGASSPGGVSEWQITVEEDGAHFGFAVGTAGDVNGDGYGDFLVQARDLGGTGQVHLFYGAPDTGETRTDEPFWTSAGNQDPWHGWRLGAAGDVNGDGHSDFFVASPYEQIEGVSLGKVTVYHGGTDAPGSVAQFLGQGEGAGDLYGTAVAFGDFNGDGADDVVVGSGSVDSPGADAGRVYVYYGPTAQPLVPDWEVGGESSSMRLGDAVASALDVDGDGYEDLLVGAPAAGGGRGEARLYRGSAAGLASTPAWIVSGDAGTDAFGFAVASAGDVNADGYADVIIGAPGTSGSNRRGKATVFLGGPSGLAAFPNWSIEGSQPDADLGYSVASAGDVDGDGFGDVIVGAPRFDAPEPNEGATFLYFGSAAGISAASPWTTESDLPGARHGWSVASAGDVNGDGFGDIVVGAPFYGVGGRVEVYEGGATLSSYLLLKEWTISQSGSEFGAAVGAADLDRDGLSDIVVGAPGIDNGQVDEGQVWAFPAPFTPWQLWFANDGNVDFGSHGTSVALGDLSGDGVPDILAGAPGELGAASSAGVAFIWSGNGIWWGGTGWFLEDEGVPKRYQMRTGDLSRPVALLGGVAGGDLAVQAVLQSPMGRDDVRLEVEIKPTGVPFDGSGTVVSGPFDTGTPLGGEGSRISTSLLLSGLAEGAYHWRGRFLADRPNWKRSPWYTPARNASTATDVRTGQESADAPMGTADTVLELSVAPVPFRETTRLRFQQRQAGPVSLRVFDPTGREVDRPFAGDLGEGAHTLTWTPDQGLAGGVYFSRLETPDGVSVARLVYRK